MDSYCEWRCTKFLLLPLPCFLLTLECVVYALQLCPTRIIMQTASLSGIGQSPTGNNIVLLAVPLPPMPEKLVAALLYVSKSVSALGFNRYGIALLGQCDTVLSKHLPNALAWTYLSSDEGNGTGQGPKRVVCIQINSMYMRMHEPGIFVPSRGKGHLSCGISKPCYLYIFYLESNYCLVLPCRSCCIISASCSNGRFANVHARSTRLFHKSTGARQHVLFLQPIRLCLRRNQWSPSWFQGNVCTQWFFFPGQF